MPDTNVKKVDVGEQNNKNHHQYLTVVTNTFRHQHLCPLFTAAMFSLQRLMNNKWTITSSARRTFSIVTIRLPNNREHAWCIYRNKIWRFWQGSSSVWNWIYNIWIYNIWIYHIFEKWNIQLDRNAHMFFVPEDHFGLYCELILPNESFKISFGCFDIDLLFWRW